jgi:hypothetical protein
MSERLYLIHRWLRRSGADHVSGDAETAEGGPSSADVALLRGDLGKAYEGYLSRIALSPDDIEAWAGLALSRYAPDYRGVDQPIWTATEVLLAVHRELRATGGAPDVAELAAWLVPRGESA